MSRRPLTDFNCTTPALPTAYEDDGTATTTLGKYTAMSMSKVVVLLARGRLNARRYPSRFSSAPSQPRHRAQPSLGFVPKAGRHSPNRSRGVGCRTEARKSCGLISLVTGAVMGGVTPALTSAVTKVVTKTGRCFYCHPVKRLFNLRVTYKSPRDAHAI